MMDGDCGVQGRRAPRLRHEVDDVVPETHEAALDEGRDRDRREHLRDRRQTEPGLGPDGDGIRPVGEPVARLEDDVAAPGDEDGPCEPVVGRSCCQFRRDALHYSTACCVRMYAAEPSRKPSKLPALPITTSPNHAGTYVSNRSPSSCATNASVTADAGRRSMSARSGSFPGRSNSSVSMTPGLTTCTRTGVSHSSTARHSENAVSAALEAAYDASPAALRRAATDEMLTIRPPPRATMRGTSAIISRTGDR